MSSFVSKIPKYSQKIDDNGIPGPGTYDRKEVWSAEDWKDAKFLTNTKWEDWWDNNIDAPFTKPTNRENPEPGRYYPDQKKSKLTQLQWYMQKS